MNPVRIIGIGNSFAGDDAAGILVARKLKAYDLPGVDIIEADLAGFDLVDLFAGSEMVLVIDAVHGEKETGAIVQLEMPKDLNRVTDLAWDSAISSTHAFGLGEALTLGDALGTLPSHLTVYGIELGHVDQGRPLSASVSEAVERVVAQIAKQLKVRVCTNSN